MNQKIIKYLQQNKDNYAKEDLIKQLQNAQYAEEEIQSGVEFVYNKDNISKFSSEGINNYKTIFIVAVIISVVGIMTWSIWYLLVKEPEKNICKDGRCSNQEKINNVPSIQDNNNLKIITIDDTNFVLYNKLFLPTGGVQYEYKQENSDKGDIMINIPQRGLPAEATHNLYKGIATDYGSEILDEWTDKKKSEYGFVAVAYSENDNITEYTVSDIVHDASVQVKLSGTVDGRTTKDSMQNVINDFRSFAMSLGDKEELRNELDQNIQDTSSQNNVDNNKIKQKKQIVVNNKIGQNNNVENIKNNIPNAQNYNKMQNNTECALDVDDGDIIDEINIYASDEYGKCSLDNDTKELTFQRFLVNTKEHVCDVDLDDGMTDSENGVCTYDANSDIMKSEYKSVSCIIDHRNGTLHYSSPKMNCDVNYPSGTVNKKILK